MHLTETCDADAPHLIVGVMTTMAPLPDGEVVGDWHAHLEKQDLAPGQHLVDTDSIDARSLAESQHHSHIDLFGPVMPDLSWQTRFRWIGKGVESYARWVRSARAGGSLPIGTAMR